MPELQRGHGSSPSFTAFLFQMPLNAAKAREVLRVRVVQITTVLRLKVGKKFTLAKLIMDKSEWISDMNQTPKTMSLMWSC